MLVTPVLGKGFDSILNSLLTVRNTILEKSDPLKFGFKANCRTMDNKFMLNRIISKQKARKKPPYVCFVDFSKVFDYINRNAIYYKLIRSGINGKLLNIIMNMFS